MLKGRLIFLILLALILKTNIIFADDNFLEQLAQEALISKTPIIKIKAGSEYTAHYNGRYQDCDYVSVKRVWDPTFRERSRIDLHNYKTCQDTLIYTGESMREKVPDNVAQYIPVIAGSCQQKGSSEYSFGDYIMMCIAVRDKDMCSVEVNILREERLLDSKIVNGCK